MNQFGTEWDYEYWMKSNGMFVGLNTPDALKSKTGNHGLPPYAKRKSFLVDKYPACPSNWMESSGRMSSYFVPVQEGKGMWLDFNKNFKNDHHVAIAISVQGVNPLTGVACEDAQLEQYLDNCPKCDTAFKPERLCEKCGVKYPKQNYLATTGTPEGKLWLDGFRSLEGLVRQYILTAEKMRGVASNLIGKDRVYAIGISFFKSKERKDFNLVSFTPSYGNQYNYNGISAPYQQLGHGQNQRFPSLNTPINWSVTPTSSSSSSSSSNRSSSSSFNPFIVGKRKTRRSGKRSSGQGKVHSRRGVSPQGPQGPSGISGIPGGVSAEDFAKDSWVNGVSDQNNIQLDMMFVDPNQTVACNFVQEVQTKNLEIGAGANINQSVYDDPEHISYWRDEPEAVIYINYALEDDVAKIISQGVRNLEGHKEGFLQNIPVGN